MTFQSSQLPVNHVQWSPYATSVFVSVCDSSICVWDLQKSILDPVMTLPVLSGGKLKKIGFAPNSNSIFVGDSDGNIQIYKVHGFEGDTKTQLQELIEASLKLNWYLWNTQNKLFSYILFYRFYLQNNKYISLSVTQFIVQDSIQYIRWNNVNWLNCSTTVALSVALSFTFSWHSDGLLQSPP